MIFNISSAGSTASAWLTVNLNKHRLITAFHGLRMSPFGEGLIYPPTMYDGLKRLSEYMNTAQFAEINQQGERTAIGIIHTYYGPEARQTFIHNGGSFMAIIRDPIHRVNSQFQATYSDQLLDSANNQKRSCEAKDVFPGFVRDTTKFLSPTDQLFFSIVENAIINDLANYQSCLANEIIIFEEMISSEQYCYARLSALTGVDDHEFRQIISRNMSIKTNTHVNEKKTSAYIFDNWPDGFKHIFLSVMHSLGIDTCARMYRELGYVESMECIM